MDDYILYLIVAPVFIGLIVASIVVASIVARYKRGLHSPTYPLGQYTSLKLTHASDVFLNRSVTRVRVNTNKKK